MLRCRAASPACARAHSSSICLVVPPVCAMVYALSNHSCCTLCNCCAALTRTSTTPRMADTVIITTQDLEPAVRLRDAFRDAGFETELLTPGERIADVTDPVLLILTGAVDEKQARRLEREAVESGGIPVLGLRDTPATITPDLTQRLGITEA